jgi:hypothetical protein
MPKPLPEREREIVMSVDRTTGVIDLRVFDTQHKRARAEIVGTVTLSMEDLRDGVSMLTERLHIEGQLGKAASTARKSKKLARYCRGDSL